MLIGPDELGTQINIYFYFSTKMYIVGTHFSEVLPMNIHKICVCGEIKYNNFWLKENIHLILSYEYYTPSLGPVVQSLKKLLANVMLKFLS